MRREPRALKQQCAPVPFERRQLLATGRQVVRRAQTGAQGGIDHRQVTGAQHRAHAAEEREGASEIFDGSVIEKTLPQPRSPFQSVRGVRVCGDVTQFEMMEESAGLSDTTLLAIDTYVKECRRILVLLGHLLDVF